MGKRDSQSPWDSEKLPSLAENWENEGKNVSNEEDLLGGIDQMASVNTRENALGNFQAYLPVQRQNVVVMKHEVLRGKLKLKERREIITINNEEIPGFIKTISTHTRKIIENSALGIIDGNYDPWTKEKRVDIIERFTTGQMSTREVTMNLTSPEELKDFEETWAKLWIPKHDGNDVTS